MHLSSLYQITHQDSHFTRQWYWTKFRCSDKWHVRRKERKKKKCTDEQLPAFQSQKGLPRSLVIGARDTSPNDLKQHHVCSAEGFRALQTLPLVLPSDISSYTEFGKHCFKCTEIQSQQVIYTELFVTVAQKYVVEVLSQGASGKLFTSIFTGTDKLTPAQNHIF